MRAEFICNAHPEQAQGFAECLSPGVIPRIFVDAGNDWELVKTEFGETNLIGPAYGDGAIQGDKGIYRLLQSTITPEKIEDEAQAMAEANPLYRWDQMPENARDIFRDAARNVLAFNEAKRLQLDSQREQRGETPLTDEEWARVIKMSREIQPN